MEEEPIEIQGVFHDAYFLSLIFANGETPYQLVKREKRFIVIHFPNPNSP